MEWWLEDAYYAVVVVVCILCESNKEMQFYIDENCVSGILLLNTSVVVEGCILCGKG